MCILLLLQITATAEIEAVTSLKLVKGHAYSITGAEEVSHLSGAIMQTSLGLQHCSAFNFLMSFSD